MTGIYKITNKINQKVYIGQSTNIKRRWNGHKASYRNQQCRQYNCSLYSDMRQYGIDNFLFEVIEECHKDELIQREIYYIDQYDSIKHGYNNSYGSSHYQKLSDDLVDSVIATLKTSKENSDIIGKKFGVSGRMIRDINAGRLHHRNNEVYPIRQHLNPKKERRCIVCGGETRCASSKYCVACAHKSQRRVERPQKKHLAKIIIQYGFVGVGQMYGVSDNAVRAWCEQYNMPKNKQELIVWYENNVA